MHAATSHGILRWQSLVLSTHHVATLRRMPKARSVTKGGADAGASSLPPTDAPSWYLIKSEPDEFSIEHLKARPNGTSCWEGVRNAQARNFMQGMRVGDRLFFYHSSCKVPGVVGLATVARTAYPDHTAWDPTSKYFDPKSPEDNPKWYMVDVCFERELSRPLTLEELKGGKDGPLAGMLLFNRPRLSVQPVSAEHAAYLLELECKTERPDRKAATTSEQPASKKAPPPGRKAATTSEQPASKKARSRAD